MKQLKWLDEHLEETLVAVVLAVTVVLMLVQIFLRYVLSSGLSWSEVICRYLLVLMGFISIGHSVRHKSSIRIDLLLSIMPRFLQKICAVIVWFITLFVLLLLFKTAVDMSVFYKEYGRVIAGTTVPIYIVYFAGPVLGLGLGLFRLFQNVICSILAWKKQGTKKLDDGKVNGGAAG